MALEGVAEFQIGVEDGIGLVPPELLQPRGVATTIHAGGHGAAFEATAAEGSRIKARGLGPQVDDPRGCLVAEHCWDPVSRAIFLYG
jgi:hypothetical protein